jgi:hypothetical protein
MQGGGAATSEATTLHNLRKGGIERELAPGVAQNNV